MAELGLWHWKELHCLLNKKTTWILNYCSVQFHMIVGSVIHCEDKSISQT